MRLFFYSVRYWEEDTNTVENVRGIVAGKSYQDALERLYDDCVTPSKRDTDEDGLISVKIEELDNPLEWDAIEEIVAEEKEKKTNSSNIESDKRSMWDE